MYDTNDTLISVENIGKMYKLYRNQRDKVMDVFGLNFFSKNTYKEFWALRNINLTIKKGERVGFIGHNGAGKSTLLKLITGNIKPTDGRLAVKGKIQALLEMGTGFHPDFTGRENIRASLAYQGLSQSDIRKLEEEIIDFTELGEYIEQPVKNYSAGMYSRLAFATASAVKPELMIIDEILGAGDAYFNAKCVERMRNLTATDGATFLFVSHDLQSVQALCTRLIWLDHGTIRYDGDVLYGIKLYLQEVRKNEERRLKLQDKKKQEKNASLLDTVDDIYDSYLFKISSRDNIAGKRGKFYKAGIYADGELVAHVSIGAAMDNDIKKECHIIDDPGKTCWGKSMVLDDNADRFYRCVDFSLGTDHSAPFRLMVSKEYADKDISIMVEADVDDNGEIILEYYCGDTYLECGTLAAGYNRNLFQLANKTKEEINVLQDKDSANDTDIDYLSAGAKILNVELLNSLQEKRKVFPFGEKIDKCCFDLLFEDDRRAFYFVFLVYTNKGDLLYSTCQHITLNKSVRSLSVQYPFPNDKLGPGEYNISIAIYDSLNVSDNSREQKFLAMIDRGCAFKVEKPMNYALSIGFNVWEDMPVIINDDVTITECENML